MQEIRKKMEKQYSPHYIRIRNDILRKIRDGILSKDSRLPSERELAEEYGVSRVTVCGALRELVNSGTIRKIRGSGSYVNMTCENSDSPDELFGSLFAPAKITIRHGMMRGSPHMFLRMQILAALFRIENPEVNVKIEVVNPKGCASGGDPYLLLVGSGNPPATGEFFFYSDYSALNMLVPLEGLPGFQDIAEKLYPGAVFNTPDASGNGHVHAIATRVNSRFIFVNLDFLEKAGIREIPDEITDEILDEWCPVLASYSSGNPGNYGIAVPMPRQWSNIVDKLPYLWGSGVDGISLEAFLNMLSSDTFLSGLSRLRRWCEYGNPAPSGEAEELFMLGKCGIFLSSTLRPWTISQNICMERNFRLFRIPPDPGRTESVSVLGNFSAGIFRSGIRSDAEMEAAWKWLRFLFQKRSQFQLSCDFDMPTLKGVRSRLDSLPASESNLIRQTIENACPQFDFTHMRPVFTVFGRELSACLKGKINPRTCVSNTIMKTGNLLGNLQSAHGAQSAGGGCCGSVL